MAELLRTTSRNTNRRREEAEVSGGEGGYLSCDLTRDHDGPLHYDSTDGIWWAAGAVTGG